MNMDIELPVHETDIHTWNTHLEYTCDLHIRRFHQPKKKKFTFLKENEKLKEKHRNYAFKSFTVKIG